MPLDGIFVIVLHTGELVLYDYDYFSNSDTRMLAHMQVCNTVGAYRATKHNIESNSAEAAYNFCRRPLNPVLRSKTLLINTQHLGSYCTGPPVGQLLLNYSNFRAVPP